MATSTSLAEILKRTGLTPAQITGVGVKMPTQHPEHIAPQAEKPALSASDAEMCERIVSELRSRRQWVAWKSILDPGAKKARKVPINPKTGKAASSTDPSTWTDFATAQAAVKRYGLAGVGFVFTADDPFCGVDLDDCRNPETGQIETWAQEIISEIASYSEVSPSGTGVKIFLRAKLPANAKHNVEYQTGSVEMYDSGRYFTVTGLHVPGTPRTIEDRQAELTAVYSAVVGKAESAPAPQSAPAAGGKIVSPNRIPYLRKQFGPMHGRGMDPTAIEAALLAENLAKCDPPEDEGKIRKMVADMTRRYPAGETREAPVLKPDLIRLADVQARAVRWLWEPFIPFGMLTMLSGDPGAGKSFIALAVCADLTRGKLRDGRIVEPGNCLHLSIEDPLAESIRPRFDALGGDPARFFALQGTLFAEDGEEQRGAVTLGDIPILDAAIAETGARLIVVDPIQSYLGSTVDLHRSNETRPVMDGLSKLAEKHGCAILLLRHLSKQSGGKAIHRGLGSIDLTGAVRSEMLAGSLPDDPAARALVHVKSNVGRMGHTLGYSIDGEGHFAWTGESPITAFDLLASPEGPERSAVERAREWLAALLKSGSKDYTTIRDLAADEGFKEMTLRRAKAALNIRSRKAAMSGGWIWSLPEDSPKDGRFEL